MKSILVIGMGKFGRHLALQLQELKNEVMIVDQDDALVEELAPDFTDAQIGDCTNENILKSLGINNFDICFVTVGGNFQASLEITALLSDLGAKRVVSEAASDIHAKFLLRNGADEVIYPEKDMAKKVAFKYSANNIFDYVEISPEYAIFEMPVPATWVDKSISELNVRGKYHVNILAMKTDGSFMPMPGADYVFSGSEHMIVLGKKNEVMKMSYKA